MGRVHQTPLFCPKAVALVTLCHCKKMGGGAGVLATSWGSGFVIYDIIQAESKLAAHADRESLSTKEAAFVALEPLE